MEEVTTVSGVVSHIETNEEVAPQPPQTSCIAERRMMKCAEN
jgi:hypothetical protein